MSIFIIMLNPILIPAMPIDIPLVHEQGESEDEFWKKTKSAHTVDAYRKYIILSEQGRYSGKYAKEAARAISDIWDEDAWLRAKEQNTKLAYQEYLAVSSNGKYSKEARKRIGPSPKTRSAAVPKENLTSAKTPGRKPPARKADKIPKREAREKEKSKQADANVSIDVSQIPLVYEDSVWRSSKDWDSETSYKDYLRKFPEGRYANEALHMFPIGISFMRGKDAPGRSSFSLAYAKNPVILAKLEVISNDKITQLDAFEISKSIYKSENLQGDSVYSYSVREYGLNARIDMPGPLDSKVVIMANKANAYNVQFRDALGRTAEISIDAADDDFKLEYLSGYSADEDTLFFKIQGGQPRYTVQFFGLDRYIVRHEAILNNDHGKSDTNIWYLEKNLLKAEGDLEGEYYLSIFDDQKINRIDHNRIVQFPSGFFGNIENVILILIIILFAGLGLGWVYMKYKESRQPKFEPIS
ncbi:MAG: hypothetical protein AAF696_12760 [Bacteroidota bacterium]